jgi:hypothetical protein
MKVIKPRAKKFPYRIEETFPPPHENVKLIIIANSDDLLNLGTDYQENPEKLGELLLNHFIANGLWEITDRFGTGKPPRGVHKQTWQFTQKMKIRAPYTFGLIDYWLKRPQEKWPKPIKKVIKEFEDEMSSFAPRSGKRKKPKAHEVTSYIMERHFGKEREKNNPASNPWTEDPYAFKKTYISHSHFMNWVKMKLDDLEKAGIKLPHELPITSEKPSDVILSLFSNSSVSSSS